MTTVSDPEGRPTVMDLVRGSKSACIRWAAWIMHSEGLLLLTNDGELANAITSAAAHIPKTYLVKVTGALTPEQEQQFREGVPLGGRRTAPAGLKLMRAQKSVVRSASDRGPQESNQGDVQTFRAAGGEAEAGEDRVFGTGSAEAGRVSAI
jgi:pseudouridine synthase